LNFKTGKCKLKKNVSKKINQLNFGRGKKFEYQYITGKLEIESEYSRKVYN